MTAAARSAASRWASGECPGGGADVDHGHGGSPSAAQGDEAGGSGGCGCRNPGHLTQEVKHLCVELLGDFGGGRVVVGSDRAGDCVVSHSGSAVRYLLDEDGDRRV